MENVRQIPSNVVAEQSVIGAIILDPSCLEAVATMLREEDFYDQYNKLIYSVITKMFSNCEKIDCVTVLNNIYKDNSISDGFNMKSYLLEACTVVPSISSCKEYASIVKNKSKLRRIIEMSNRIIEKALQNDDKMIDNILGSAEDTLWDIKSDNSNNRSCSIQDTLIESANRLGEDSKGLQTGFIEFDKATGGLNKSDLVLIAARPGMGKTSFALSLANNISKSHKVHIFSLEMSKEQLGQRILSIDSTTTFSKDLFRITTDEWQHLYSSALGFDNKNIIIDDTPSMNVQLLKSKVRFAGDVDLVIIDYLQLLNSSTQRTSRVQEVTEITRQLKILAKDLNIPVICLSQLSRACETRQDHRPMLSDLRDSGSIEQDADMVLMLYRPYYYSQDEQTDPSECECIIAKNRYGTPQTVKFSWDPNFTKFS